MNYYWIRKKSQMHQLSLSRWLQYSNHWNITILIWVCLQSTGSRSVGNIQVTIDLTFSGIGSNPTSVLTSQGMLSLPLGSIGLGPFVSGLKQQPGSGIRAPTTLPLLQVSTGNMETLCPFCSELCPFKHVSYNYYW